MGKFFVGCCYVNNVPPVFYLNNPFKRIISHCPFLFILYEIEDILFVLLKIIAFQCHKPLSIPVSYLLARRTEDGKCLFIALSPFIKAFIHWPPFVAVDGMASPAHSHSMRALLRQ